MHYWTSAGFAHHLKGFSAFGIFYLWLFICQVPHLPVTLAVAAALQVKDAVKICHPDNDKIELLVKRIKYAPSREWVNSAF